MSTVEELTALVKDLELQLGQLMAQVAAAEQCLKDAAERFNELRLAHNELFTAHRTLWKRFNSFYPERTRCPHCGAVVHAAARACKSCGRSWGQEPDPKAGLPR